MPKDTWQFRLDRDRERLLDEALAKSGYTNRADLVEGALRHYIETHDVFDDVKREISPEFAERIGTSEVKITMYPDVRH